MTAKHYESSIFHYKQLNSKQRVILNWYKFYKTTTHPLCVIQTFLFLMLILSTSGNSALALERFDIVTTLQVSELLEKRKTGEVDFLLINALDRLIADHQSIPGSINIPWSEGNKSSAMLGPDKERLIITYCMGYR